MWSFSSISHPWLFCSMFKNSSPGLRLSTSSIRSSNTIYYLLCLVCYKFSTSVLNIQLRYIYIYSFCSSALFFGGPHSSSYIGFEFFIKPFLYFNQGWWRHIPPLHLSITNPKVPTACPSLLHLNCVQLGELEYTWFIHYLILLKF